MAAILMQNNNFSIKLPDGYMDHDFLAYLERQGFAVQFIIGDGNYMFRSVADVIVEDQEKHQRYRRLAVQHIAFHKEEFKDFNFDL